MGVGLAGVGFVALRQWKGCPQMKPGDAWEAREAGARGDAPRRGAPPGVRLPCLNSNNCTGSPLTEAQKADLNRLSTSHRKTAFALAENVSRLCRVYGIERIGFLTLTFADHVTCAKEASRRYHSLRTHVLVGRYVETICVMERMKSGRIHYHLLVVLAVDVRTGFDFEQAANRVYASANDKLRAEWTFWRSNARKYGFGRTELLPVKSNGEGLSKYVGKYIAKHIDARESRDKGVRLVRYSKGANACGTKFQFRSPRSRLWRWQVGEFAKRSGCTDLASIKERFGPRWAYHQRSYIMSLEPPPLVLFVKGEGEDEEWVTLWDIWDADRFTNSDRIARATGRTQAEVYLSLYQPDFESRIARANDPETPKRDAETASCYAAMVERANDLESKRTAGLNDEGERVEVTRIMWEPDSLEITTAQRIPLR